MLISLCWKNLWRNPLRSGVVVASVALGLSCGIFATAFMNGMARQTIESAVSTELSHLQIHDPAYVEEPLPARTIPGADLIVKTLRSDPGIREVAARTRVEGMATTAKTGAGVLVKGVDPGEERAIGDLPDDVSHGAWFTGSARNPIVIGEKLADRLGADVKDRIVVTTQTVEGDLTGGAFRVDGIFRTQNSAFDEHTVFVKRQDLSRLVGAPDEAIHEIAVLLPRYQASDSAAAALRARLPGLSVQTWKELRPDVGVMESLLAQMMYLFVLVILVALTFGIVNTMLMAVLDRRREFGMLMAVGMGAGRIFAMVLVETVILALTGGMVGMALAGVAVAVTARTGIDLSHLSQGLAALGYSPMVHPSIDAAFFGGITVLVVVTGILAAIYPALRALSLDPADAVRSDT